MVRAAVVFQRVLNELKAGQARRRRTTGDRCRPCCGGERRVRPCRQTGRATPEDRPHRLVALQIDAADFARAVIEIEVGRELRMVGLELIFGRPAPLARGRWLGVASALFWSAVFSRWLAVVARSLRSSLPPCSPPRPPVGGGAMALPNDRSHTPSSREVLALRPSTEPGESSAAA